MSTQLSFVTPLIPVFDAEGQQLPYFSYPTHVAKPEETPAHEVAGLLNHPSLGIIFSKFTDGRGFSLAARIRESGYRGELHAMGEVNQELMFLLSRVGFTHFHLPHDTQTLAPEVVQPFSAFYQGGQDGSLPVWKRAAVAADVQTDESAWA